SLSTIASTWLFLFQAEDGIRVRNVTGVQTCALPIYRYAANRRSGLAAAAQPAGRGGGGPSPSRRNPFASGPAAGPGRLSPAGNRSEERRVGKECRGRWRPHPQTAAHRPRHILAACDI